MECQRPGGRASDGAPAVLAGEATKVYPQMSQMGADQTTPAVVEPRNGQISFICAHLRHLRIKYCGRVAFGRSSVTSTGRIDRA